VSLQTPSLPRFFSAAEPHRLAVLKALWPAIAGEGVANHSEVVGIQGEVMRVRADTGSWLETMRDLKGVLVMRLQRAAGPLAPRALAFVEGPITRRAPRLKARPPLQPVDLVDLPAAVRDAALKIPTPEGREVYLRAAAAFEARFRKPVKP
jgi:Dna[CI] antecedent, DciA